jgi:antirestriction protein ArdC
MKRDLYADVSARIVAELEAGAAPWVKPWSATAGANTPCNASSNRPYSGCNVVLLWMAQAAGYRTPRFLTFKQALELGGNVRKGERGTKVYFVKQLQVRDQGADDSSSTRLIPMMREYSRENREYSRTGRTCPQGNALAFSSRLNRSHHFDSMKDSTTGAVRRKTTVNIGVFVPVRCPQPAPSV